MGIEIPPRMAFRKDDFRVYSGFKNFETRDFEKWLLPSP